MIATDFNEIQRNLDCESEEIEVRVSQYSICELYKEPLDRSHYACNLSARKTQAVTRVLWYSI